MNIIDLNVCRVCLNRLEKNGNSILGDPNILNKFETCTDLKIRTRDGLPSCICDRCNARLRIAFDFKQQAASSDGQLRAFINEISNQFDEVANEVVLDTKDDTIQNLIEIKENQDTDQIEFEILSDDDSVADDGCEMDPLNVSNKDAPQSSTKSTKSKSTMGSYICTKCNKSFTRSSNLRKHLDTHEGLKPYKCTTCGKCFTQSSSLKKHILLHTGEKPHACDVCGRRFTQQTTLVFHMRIHTGEKPFPCDQCDRAFRKRSALKLHIDVSHSKIASPKVCKICKCVFQSKYTLQQHMKRHDQNTTYECETCNKVFTTKLALNVHNRRHNEIRIVKCDECGREFNDKLSLKKHLKTHMEVKPFACSECDKSFTQEKLLKDHIEFLHINNTLLNKNSKIYQCEFCRKQYIIKENLIQHLKIHKEK